MNSAQRRQAKREHPHVTTIHAKIHHPYYEHDEKVYYAVNWCRKHCKGSFLYATSWDCAEFKFSNQKDAVYFALKWS
jgi:hypothetical protein